MNPRRNRKQFRPNLDGFALEERVVLSVAPAVLNLRGGPAWLVGNANATVGQVSTRAVSGSPSTAAQVGSLNVTQAQLRTALLRAFRNSYRDLRTAVDQAAAQLFAQSGGNISNAALQNFNNYVQGIVNLTTYRQLSLASVVPGGSRLASAVQTLSVDNSFGRSLINRLDNVVRNGNYATTGQLQRQLNRQISLYQAGSDVHLQRFVSTTNFNRLSVDANTGQRVSLARFIGGQIASQFGNNLAAMANAFNTNAATSLFANGATPTAAQLSSFNNSAYGALGTLGFGLANSLSLIPGAQQALLPTFQNAFFGNGSLGTGTGTGTGTGIGTGTGTTTTFTNFLNGLSTLANQSNLTGTMFNQGGTSLFTDLFGNTINPLNSFFGLPAVTNPSLVSNPLTNQFNAFNSFANGFNTGFGSGFIGFGTNPALGTNPNFFGNGFFNGINTGLTNFGFQLPTGQFSTPLGTTFFTSDPFTTQGSLGTGLNPAGFTTINTPGGTTGFFPTGFPTTTNTTTTTGTGTPTGTGTFFGF